VTIAKRPSDEVRDGNPSIAVSTHARSKIFFQEGLDRTGKSVRPASPTSSSRAITEAIRRLAEERFWIASSLTLLATTAQNGGVRSNPVMRAQAKQSSASFASPGTIRRLSLN
jgi:hypothetical protein